MLTAGHSGSPRARPNVLSLDARKPIEHGLFGLLPLLVAGWACYAAFSGGYAGGDFRNWLFMVHGHSLYAWTAADRAAGLSFPYPALTAVLLTPFTWLTTTAAGILGMTVCLLALLATLWLLAVRDWRVYGACLLWAPVIIAWRTANLTLLLGLAFALCWRYRDRRLIAGGLTALMISVKPTMFPVGVWLLVTRRYRAAGYALIIGVLVNVLAWTLLGWHELNAWLHLVSVQSRVLYKTGYSVVALLAHMGVGRGTGTVIEVFASLAGLGGCIYLGLARRDNAAFALTVAVCLVASPLIDQHYFALLVVPLALAFPRLRWPWVLPLGLWVCPATGGSVWQVGLWLVVAAVITFAAVRSLVDQRRPSDQEVVAPDRTSNPAGVSAAVAPLAAMPNPRPATGGGHA